MKSKNATINLINDDDKCFYKEIKKNLQGSPQVKHVIKK